MLSEIKNNYKDIFAHFNFNSAERNKQKLIEMAKNGEKRPSGYLNKALGRYIYESGDCYDPTFTKQIKKLRPDWFYKNNNRLHENKQKLIEMAKNGEKRPTIKCYTGRILASYICRSSHYYDPTFTKQIKKLRPDWFYKVRVNKQKLIEMAKNGEKRPKCYLGTALTSYTCKSCGCFDPIFTKQIKKLRPDWFYKIRVQINKQKLIDMAKNGEKRPTDPYLNERLRSYVCKSSDSYDPIFTKQIKKLRPDWFRR